MATMTASVSSAGVAAADRSASVVLVHGAFVDGSGWKAVFDLLTKRGYEVLVVQNATVTLKDDVETTRRAIAQAKYPVTLVAHSYGGAVITEAGADSKVQSLVYIAAYAPEVGESVYDLATRPGADVPPLLPPKDGFLFVDPTQFPAAFAADVDVSITAFMAAAQVPWGLDAVQPKITSSAWKTKPVHFLLTTQDHMIPPGTQRMMALRAKAKTVEVDSSHAVMLSHPEIVADFIANAEQSAK